MLEIMRQFIHGKSKAQKTACLEYMMQTNLIYRMLNIASIATQVGNQESLELVLENNV